MWLDRELAYRYSAGIEEGERRGIQVGILEGSRQKAEETAKNFLKMGLPIEQIAKGTGLSIEEIQKLK